jgi:hypothetical protein
MRFSVKKTALAILSSAAKGGSKGKGWGINPEENPSAVGAAPCHPTEVEGSAVFSTGS